MPVRSSGSSILRWPDQAEVDAAVRRFANDLAARSEVMRVGYFGSYLNGNWGVGSDVDIVILVDHSDEPFTRRALAFDVSSLPVPADVFVYTLEEVERLSPTASREALWVLDRLDTTDAQIR